MDAVATARELTTGTMLWEVRVPSYQDRTPAAHHRTGGELYAVASAALLALTMLNANRCTRPGSRARCQRP